MTYIIKEDHPKTDGKAGIETNKDLRAAKQLANARFGNKFIESKIVIWKSNEVASISRCMNAGWVDS